MIIPAQVSSKILRRQKTPLEYAVYKAALEWDLEQPIVIESAEDVRSEVMWRDLVEPYQHQVENLITFCRRLPVTLLADDVGLGKTISAGLIVSELIARSRISKILIVCPKLLGPQWQEELHEKFAIESQVVSGSDLVKAEPTNNGAVITTYHSARSHLEKIPEDRFDMLILDEAHKLRNLYGVESPPQVAQRFRKALEERRFRYVLMLTATPIQNRLWDIYSLVDLLTVARGHENPFGSEGMFARKFIEDDRGKARRLRDEARDEFRSIVFGYMSRVRRSDANLYFPDRVVQMHKVLPSQDELTLIDLVGRAIQKLNRLTQISVLQALVSSPDALRAQLNNMARNKTFPTDVAATVDRLVQGFGISAKLSGLKSLVETLMEQNPDSWRLVVFTTRRETQTTIESFLSDVGLTVGCINGQSGAKNQKTITDFKSNPPKIRVIVSTEAGSEGVNLQAANVLVNFDLPWNPMVVEQRIGRVQRLASEHKTVAIFNITLAGTFEEYIVGRLMEKLQMASHAIGDVESLLEGSGLDEGDEGKGFEERIRELVVQALAGKDVEEAARLAEASILKAKETLEQESKEIDSLLGSASGKEYVGPRTPKLPIAEPSMSVEKFTLGAFEILGAAVSERQQGVFQIERGTGRRFVHFDKSLGDQHGRSVRYHPGAPGFLRLVNEVSATGIYELRDRDRDTNMSVDQIALKWVSGFGGVFDGGRVDDVERRFCGSVLVRVRASVAHDSYERLVAVDCDPSEHNMKGGRDAVRDVPEILEEPPNIGINLDAIYRDALEDAGVAEFRRFYLERKADEIGMAGDDERKKKKLEDEFTPEFSTTVVGFQGELNRDVHLTVSFGLGEAKGYSSSVVIRPSTGEFIKQPEIRTCALSGQNAPSECFDKCAVTGKLALRHLLEASQVSGRRALPDQLVTCAVSAQRVLPEECGMSEVSGARVLRALLIKSDVSGFLAEEIHTGKCEFTGATALVKELEKSEVSGMIFRKDEKAVSVVSGVSGHVSEFVRCEETRQLILASEAGECAVTGKRVIDNLLEKCVETGKRVLPSELDRCTESGALVLRTELETSSVSGEKILRSKCLKSSRGAFCSVREGKTCQWSGEILHPDDIEECTLTGLRFSRESMQSDPRTIETLSEMLAGVRRSANQKNEWPKIASLLSEIMGGAKCEIEAAVESDRTDLMACVAKVKKLFGLRTQIVGFFFDRKDGLIFGEVAVGKRSGASWQKIGPV